ncbi:hypothetical protein FB45DRAFT_1066361 [Roridomyces roridus]|uniref:F-box domain-containing protein n=1 Tax=Roridomyces roridus TaxID=1738132 RepID=A0AAD7B521_9AGAR|nr:hypothetical protein FB45DRAFT_1066361 [Roridomyces roridus]
MLLQFSDVPLDILLEIAKELDLSDSRHLAATCSACAALLQSPSFWIESLHRMEKIYRRPIPCTPGTDLTFLPLYKLRDMAVHAYKLRKNWASESPLPVTIRSHYIAGESYSSHILPIEGTHMVLVVFDGSLACLNTTTGEYLAKCHPDATFGQCSRPFYSAEMCSVGFARYHYDQNELAFAVFNLALPRDNHENTLGVVGSMGGEDRCLFYCRTTEPQELHRFVLVIQPTSSANAPAAFAGVAVGHDFFVFMQDHGQSAEIIHATPTHTHTTRHDHPPVTPNERPALRARELRHSHMRPPTYGILNVVKRPTEDGSAHRILFWPAEYSAAHGANDSALTVGPVCSYQHTTTIDCIAVGSSGTCVVIKDPSDAVFLLQYIRGPTPHVESRRLPIPPKVALPWQEIVLAVDDRSGVVYQARNSPDAGLPFKVFEFA